MATSKTYTPIQKVNLLWISLLLLVPFWTQAQQLTDYNPVSHWTCDETSGVRYDSNTTNSNDLTDNNTVGYATGLRGNACDFESSNSEYLSIANASQQNLDNTGDFCISAWIKSESQPAVDGAVGLIMKLDANEGYGMQYYNSATSSKFLRTRIYNLGNADNPIWDVTFPDNTWKHVIWSFNDATSDHTVFLDGVSKGTWNGTRSPGTHTKPFHLGALTETTSAYFDGLMDEVTVFDTTCDQSEATAIFNSGTPLPYTSTSTGGGSSTTATSTTADLSDTNFMLAVIIFFLTFIFLGLAFSPLNRK